MKKINIVECIKSLTNKSCFDVAQYSKSSGNVTSGSYASVNFDVVKSGYNAIGVVGFTSGHAYLNAAKCSYDKSTNSVNVVVRNNGSATCSGTVVIDVLYQKAGGYSAE